MIMKFELYNPSNNTWQDYTNYIVNELMFDERIDEVFDSGTLTIQTKVITKNIPPNTLCRINESDYYLAKSTCNLVIPSDAVYNHDITLVESTFALLQTLINEKALSNRGAFKTLADKTNILIALANQHNAILYAENLKLEFTIDNTNLPNIEREFTFGRGTSLFHALLEIGKSVDCIPYVKSVDVNYYKRTYNVAWLNLGSNANIDYEIDEKYLLKFEMEQNQEEYTRVLETHIDNVVDRDTINKVYNLAVTSNDAIISADNSIIKLPSNAEEITHFQINFEGDNTFESVVQIDFKDVAFTEAQLSSLIGNSDTLQGWMRNAFVGQYVTSAYNHYIERYQCYLPYDLSLTFTLSDDISNNTYCIISSRTNNEISVNITNALLETNQFELLEAHNKPKYAVYTSGSNTIENLYEQYKNDIWNKILGYEVKPFLSHAFNDIYVEGTGYKLTLYVLASGNEIGMYNPSNYTYNIFYKPIVTTYIKSTNEASIKNPNENKLTPSARSYEVSSAYADFNLIQSSINKTNEMLGKTEITLEIQVNDEMLSSLELGKRIKLKCDKNKALEYLFRDYPYYIISMQKHSVVGGATSVQLNLVNSFTKVAEVIGVASQYESTKNALKGILERVVYCGELSISLEDYRNPDEFKPTGLIITPSVEGATPVYVRGTLIEYENDNYLIVKALDQYALTTGIRENLNLSSGYKENYQYSYADSSNECVSYHFKVVQEYSNLTKAQSLDVASFVPSNHKYNILTNEFDITTYKDSRETLIFVVKYHFNFISTE